jgi:hypothetical protein
MMHIGSSYYGKVDVVPNLCHVATRFLHVNFVPIVPIGTYIIPNGNGKRHFGGDLKTFLSFKSILTAWMRGGLMAIAICLGIAGIIVTSEYFGARRQADVFPIVLVWGMFVAALFFFWVSYWFNRASYERALQLGTELGLEREVIEEILRFADTRGATVAEPAKEPEGWERYS